MCLRTTSGINSSFPELSPSLGQVAYVLRTRSPLSHPRIATLLFSLDLHVLTTPPAFTLSQNQTLRKNLLLKIPIDCSTFCVVIYFFYISIRWTFFKVVAKKIFGWFAQSYLVNFKELLFFIFPDFLVKGHSSRTIFQPLSREFFVFLKVFFQTSQLFRFTPFLKRNFGSS